MKIAENPTWHFESRKAIKAKLKIDPVNWDQRTKVLMRCEGKFMLECQLLFSGEKECRESKRQSQFVIYVDSWSINDAQRCWFLQQCGESINHHRGVAKLSISFSICKRAKWISAENVPNETFLLHCDLVSRNMAKTFHCFFGDELRVACQKFLFLNLQVAQSDEYNASGVLFVRFWLVHKLTKAIFMFFINFIKAI